MALFVLGDPHLSLGGAKPMDVFPGWDGYVEKLEANWRKLVKPEDTVVLAGDISWAMRLSDTRKDFAFLHSLPGRKLLMKGNHDYWWSTANKMNAFFKAEGFDSLQLLHNNSYTVGDYALCGTRGWLFDVGEPHDEKVMNREIGRLRLSLDAAEPGLEKLAFLHYPPVAKPFVLPCRARWTASVISWSARTGCASARIKSREMPRKTSGNSQNVKKQLAFMRRTCYNKR